MTTTDASDFDLQVIADPDIINGYLRDASNLKGHASGLLRPTSTAGSQQLSSTVSAILFP